MRIAIIGGGAAGCFAAANIPRVPGQEVAVFEKTGKVLQKVRVSGGGRCNVTHECYDVPELLEAYPRGKQLLKRSLFRFPPQRTIDWFQSHGVKLKVEEDGRIFPVTDSSETIIECIWQLMMANNAKVFYHRSLVKVEQQNGKFILHFADTSVETADRLLVTTGGYPKTEQYHWLVALGHSIQRPVPSLFTFNMPGNPITGLMGLSVPAATVKVAGTKITATGPLLITHWGMSGPAVLKTSALGARELADRGYDFRILINWVGGSDDDLKEAFQKLRQESGGAFVAGKNSFDLPRRLWEHQLALCGIKQDTRWGDLSAAAQNKLHERLLRDTYEVKGKTTFKEEFVTCGGINISEIDPQTMQSRVVQGLYFAGEILDVDGITGGYNFQHAWSSGYIAAQNIGGSRTE